MARNAPPMLTSPDVLTSACFSPSRCPEGSGLPTAGELPSGKAGDSTCTGSPALSPTPLTSPGASSCASAVSVLSSPMSAASDVSVQPRDLFSTPHGSPASWPLYSTPEPGLPPLAPDVATASRAGTAGDPVQQASSGGAGTSDTAGRSVSTEQIGNGGACTEQEASRSPHVTAPSPPSLQNAAKEVGAHRRRGKETARSEKSEGAYHPSEESQGVSVIPRPAHILRISCSDSSRSTTSEAGAELFSSPWEGCTPGAVTPSSGASNGKALSAEVSPEQSEGEVSLDTTDNSGENTVSTSQTILSSRCASRKSSLERGETVGDVSDRAALLPGRSAEGTERSSSLRKRERLEGRASEPTHSGISRDGECLLLPFSLEHPVGIKDACAPRLDPFAKGVNSPSGTRAGSASDLLRSLSSGLADSLDRPTEDGQGGEEERMSFERLESFCDAVRTPSVLRRSGASLSTDSSDASAPALVACSGGALGELTPRKCCGRGSSGWDGTACGWRRSSVSEGREAEAAAAVGGVSQWRRASASQESQALHSTVAAGDQCRIRDERGAPECNASLNENAVCTNVGSRRGDSPPVGCEKVNAVVSLPCGQAVEETESFAGTAKRRPELPAGAVREKLGKESSLFCCACCGGRLLCSQCSGTRDVHGVETVGYETSNSSAQRLPGKFVERCGGADAPGDSGGGVTGCAPCRVCAESIYCGFCVYRMQAAVSVSCAPPSERLPDRGSAEGQADALRRQFNGVDALDSLGGSVRDPDVGTSSLCTNCLSPGCRQTFPCVPHPFGESGALQDAPAWFSGGSSQAETKPDDIEMLGGSRALFVADSLTNGLGLFAHCTPAGSDMRGESSGQAAQPVARHLPCQRQAASCRFPPFSQGKPLGFEGVDEGAGATECGALIGLDGVVGRSGSLGLVPLQGDVFSPQRAQGVGWEQMASHRHSWPSCAPGFLGSAGIRPERIKTDAGRKANSDAWKQEVLVPALGAWPSDSHALCSATHTTYRGPWDLSRSCAADAALHMPAMKTDSHMVEGAGLNRTHGSEGLAVRPAERGALRSDAAGKTFSGHCMSWGVRENLGVNALVAREGGGCPEDLREGTAQVNSRVNSPGFVGRCTVRGPGGNGELRPLPVLPNEVFRTSANGAEGDRRFSSEYTRLIERMQDGNCAGTMPHSAVPSGLLHGRPARLEVHPIGLPRRSAESAASTANGPHQIGCTTATHGSSGARACGYQLPQTVPAVPLPPLRARISAEAVSPAPTVHNCEREFRQIDHRREAGCKRERSWVSVQETEISCSRCPFIGTQLNSSAGHGNVHDEKEVPNYQAFPRRQQDQSAQQQLAAAANPAKNCLTKRRRMDRSTTGRKDGRGDAGAWGAQTGRSGAARVGSAKYVTGRGASSAQASRSNADTAVTREAEQTGPEAATDTDGSKPGVSASRNQLLEAEEGRKLEAATLRSRKRCSRKPFSGEALTQQMWNCAPDSARAKGEGTTATSAGSSHATDYRTEKSGGFSGDSADRFGSPARSLESDLLEVISSRRKPVSARASPRPSTVATVSPGVKTSKRRRGEKCSTSEELDSSQEETTGSGSSGSVEAVDEVAQGETTEGQRGSAEREQGASGDQGGCSGTAPLEESVKTEAAAEQESSSPPGRGSNGRFWRAGGDGRVLYDQSGQKISGIWFDSGRRLWRVVFTQGERRRTKGFSLRQYGFEEARNMAVQCKLEMEARKGEKATNSPVSPAK
ncbi:unnamed protein product [Neospora caninum Liverpool]|uniref:AP2/ERF domain-containing protein n=1 Tax=Neospora caninum (strain Liverpool) TaxID=572307 RepID=F0VJ86_NEOCL|nr:uncharacterized protein NCLIV_035780 [Neospora caninum Liverpool]CBZ53797.1 unnamed protein product [Neospora caninum Liverpool]|eukprot:XP_003883829.1 uncharacterized protein NCLIV_035780 [Neospora caninum Liverpool]